jgi:fructose-1,6-bisphosphatase II
MLYIGEKVGNPEAAVEVDIAVDPLEGTNLVATGSANATAVLAAAEPGGLMHAPDTYMQKLIVGPQVAGHVSIDDPVEVTIRTIAERLGRGPWDITVVILDRPRHEQLIADVRATGARIKLISDGDLPAGISVAVSGTGVHAVMGIGGAPEGVLAAAAMKCLGGEIQGKFAWRSKEEMERARTMGVDVDDTERVYFTDDLASGQEVVFSATGVTDGELLRGVRFFGGGARTHSLLMSYKRGTVRFIDTVHTFDRQLPPRVRL